MYGVAEAMMRTYRLGVLRAAYVHWRKMSENTATQVIKTGLEEKERSEYALWEQLSDSEKRLHSRTLKFAEALLGHTLGDVRRTAFRRWVQFVRQEKEGQRKRGLAELIMGTTARGTQQLTWNRWTAFLRLRRRQRAMRHQATVLLQHAVCGSMVTTYRRLQNHRIEQRQQRHKKTLGVAMLTHTQYGLSFSSSPVLMT